MSDVLRIADFAADSYELLVSRLGAPSAAMPASRIPGRQDSYFAVDAAQNFYLLIRVEKAISMSETRLDAIRISAGSRFTLAEEGAGALEDVPFASVVLDRAHLPLLTAFGTLSGVLLAALPASPSTPQLTQFLGDFRDLFAPRVSAAREVVLGLWGELWVMKQVADTSRLVNAWHLDGADRYDFSFEHVRLEVKTTEQERRLHSFALTQLSPQKKPTWIASLAAVADPSGTSVVHLMAEILDSIRVEERARFSRLCLAALGGDLESAADYRFSPYGMSPLALIPASDVPKVVVPEGAPITGVRFRADITAEATAARMDLENLLA